MTGEPASGWLEGGEHVLPVRVYYEDTDFTGLVYHGAYVRFFERGRSDALRTAGVRHAELAARAEPLAFAVTRLCIDFRRAARIDDALMVRTAFDPPAGARLPVRQRILRAQELIAQAQVEVACIGLSGRPRRPPKDLLQALSPLLVRLP